MITDDAYIPAARRLHRAGEWDTALALLDGRAGDDAAVARARILVERHWWRLDDPAAAEAAVEVLDAGGAESRYLRAQLAYTRVLFGRDPRPDDAATADAGFQAAARDGALRGWGAFWLGIVADNVHGDPATAGTRYAEALRLSRAAGDPLLESYAVRHLGGQAMAHDRTEGELLLRRSLYLRAALGARP